VNSSRPGPHQLQGLPTLTEVIEMPAFGRGSIGVELQPPLPEALPAPPEGEVEVARAGPFFIDEEQLVQRVLTDLQRNADLMLEYRLRQALAPALARLSDALIRDVRDELAVTLHDVVSRAVNQELARHRGR